MLSHEALMDKIIERGVLFYTATLIQCVAINLKNRTLTAIPDQSLEGCLCRSVNRHLHRETNLDHVFSYCFQPANIHKQIVYHCPYGLTNIIVPVWKHGHVVAGLLAGPILNSEPEQIMSSVHIPDMDCHKDMLVHELSKYTYYDVNQILALSELLASLVSPLSEEPPGDPNVHIEEDARHSAMIQLVLNYIKNHYHEKITLSDAAKAVYVNPSYLSRIFNKEVQTSFTAYLNQYRIEKSKELLANQNINIVDVCLLVGFENQSYYNKVFKKIEGGTPSQYRREMVKIH